MGVFRLLLACSVLLGHTGGHGFFGLAFLDREIAVQSFFVISGFYMALVLNEKYTGPGRYGTFLQQRFLRLFPTYLIILFSILLIDATISWVTHAPFGSLKAWYDNIHVITPGAALLYVTANLTIFGQDVTAILQQDQATGQLYLLSDRAHHFVPCGSFILNSPSWTLAVELDFYLLAPLLVCRSVRFQTMVLLSSFILRCAFLYIIIGRETPWSYCFFPSNLFFFMAGSLGYLFYKRNRSQIEVLASSHSWIFWVFGAIVVTYNRLPYAHQLYLVFLPFVFLMVPLLFAVTRNNRFDRLTGELSYPFYLLHSHVLILMKPLFIEQKQWLYGPSCVAVTLLLSYLFYRFIELKTEHFRESLYQKKKNPAWLEKNIPSSTTLTRPLAE
jgi:peptidoglycan/LPS O-acetylase OafA/YrhL